MRQDALLRSGKGLEIPSPTRKKGPVAVVAPVPAEERDDHFAVRNGVPCAGVHLIIDLHGAEGLNDIDLIDATLRRCVAAVGATLLHISTSTISILQRGVGRGGAGGEPYLDPYVAGYRLCGARRVHVRQGRARRLHPDPARGIQGPARVAVNELLRGREP